MDDYREPLSPMGCVGVICFMALGAWFSGILIYKCVELVYNFVAGFLK